MIITAAIVAATLAIGLIAALTEPGHPERLATWPHRFTSGLAYHRAGGRHTARRATPETTITVPDAGPFAARAA